MAIKLKLPKPNLKQTLGKLVSPFFEEQIDQRVKEKFDLEMTKVQAADIMRLNPSYLGNFPEGSMKKAYPLGVDYGTLRDFANYYPIARSCIEFRKSQITQLAWNVVPKELTKKTIEDNKNIQDSEEIMKFFKHPTGKRESSFTDWIKQIMEDLLVIDAVAIYRRRNRGGEIIGYLPVDGSTIELFLEKDGTLPDPPSPAYRQRISGREYDKFTKDELIYRVMNPRTYNPFGISPVENLIIIITTALKLQAYQLSFLTEGNVPEGFVELPKDIASSRDQLKEWQDAWDAMLSGDPRFQNKLKFLPFGMKYTPVRKSEDMTFERFEKWLLQNTCFDDQTEILTENGWKLFKDLVQDDKVATRSKDGFFEWQKPTNYQKYFYEGEMVKFKNDYIDLLVTPNHRMLTTYNHGRERGFSEYKIEKAINLVEKDGHLAPLTSDWNGKEQEYFILPESHFVRGLRNGKKQIIKIPEIKINIGDWCAFLGLWLADGFAKGSKGGSFPGTTSKTINGTRKVTPYLIGISQKSKNKTKKIEEMLEKLPFNWQKRNHDFVTQSKSLWKYLYELGNVYTKRIPRDILKLPKDKLEILWNWFLLGDGYKIKAGNYGYSQDRETVTSVNYEMLGDFQELLQKIGYSGSVYKRPLKNYFIEGRSGETKQSYTISRRLSKHVKTNGTLMDYVGMVYDCTVLNGTLYVRRNGKPIWTGNCAIFQVAPSDIGFNFETNRSTSQTAYEVGKERGMFPLALWIKELMDEIIQEDFKKESLEHNWTNLNPTNKVEEMKVAKDAITTGMMSIDEWRIGENLKPIGVDEPFIQGPLGAVFVKGLFKQYKEGEVAVMPYKPPAEATVDQTGVKATVTPNVAQATKPKVQNKAEDIPLTIHADTNEVIKELRRWRKASINDWKEGKQPRFFKTDIIDLRTQQIIKNQLKTAKTKEEIDGVFLGIISSHGKLVAPLMKLYDDINQLISIRKTENIAIQPTATN